MALFLNFFFFVIKHILIYLPWVLSLALVLPHRKIWGVVWMRIHFYLLFYSYTLMIWIGSAWETRYLGISPSPHIFLYPILISLSSSDPINHIICLLKWFHRTMMKEIYIYRGLAGGVNRHSIKNVNGVLVFPFPNILEPYGVTVFGNWRTSLAEHWFMTGRKEMI